MHKPVIGDKKYPELQVAHAVSTLQLWQFNKPLYVGSHLQTVFDD